jgi:hypothetical protein
MQQLIASPPHLHTHAHTHTRARATLRHHYSPLTTNTTTPPKAVTHLLTNGAVATVDNSDEEHLRDAAHRNEPEQIAALLAAGVNVNAADYDGRTALHIAASDGHVDAVVALLKGGADRTVVDRFGSMPIHDAQRYTEIQHGLRCSAAAITTAATAHHPSPQPSRFEAAPPAAAITFECTNTPQLTHPQPTATTTVTTLTSTFTTTTTCHRAVFLTLQRYKHSKVESLIRDDSKVDFDKLIVRSRRATSLDHDHGASNRELLVAAENGDLADIKRLKLKRANLLGADYDGRTALHIAAKRGHMNVVKFLVSSVPGINVNAQDTMHSTPYTEARKAGHNDVADFLFANGATEMDNSGAGASLCTAAYVYLVTSLTLWMGWNDSDC